MSSTESLISKNLRKVVSELPESVTLVAVTKTKSPEEIMKAYQAGHRDFGENKIQEMSKKWELLPKDIRWHMIGHVQRNKVKYMAPFVTLVHGVDSFRLLKEIDKQGAKHSRVIPCLLQVHIAEESTKFGLSEEEIMGIVNSGEFRDLKNIRVEGLMGMATFTSDMEKVRKEFAYLRQMYQRLQIILPEIKVLSMGMSADFPVAIEEGSNMVRIGSRIFGERNY